MIYLTYFHILAAILQIKNAINVLYLFVGYDLFFIF